MKKLGNHIRRYRFNRGMISQEDLAREVGVTRQTIHSIERGKFIPSAYLAFKIAKFFDVRVDEVFFLAGESEKEQSNE
jgi:putative transcriptional regulator